MHDGVLTAWKDMGRVTDIMLHVAAIVAGIGVRWSLLKATYRIRSF